MGRKKDWWLFSDETPVREISLESNKDYVDSLVSYDPREEIEGKIDREMILDLLKPEEKELVLLLEQGHTWKQIAKELHKSERDINKLIRWIRVKLGQ